LKELVGLANLTLTGNLNL